MNVTEEATAFLSHQLYVLRSLLYLLTPSETYYAKVEETPNLTDDAVKTFFGLILIEQVVHLLKKGRFNGRLNDAVTSLGAGIFSRIPTFFTRSIQLVTYAWIYENYLIYEIAWDSLPAYIISFLFIDMMYYWFHRAAHELNLFWAAHQTHHSAEDYNLTTALRQSVFQQYTSFMFYLPLAFFVRPSIFVVHSHMNLIYQFWIHTEVIDSIGPLEYILNTPSHHRVHHGRNPYCIDKNYAGVLIIWDRMFGTFEAERKDEEIAYGLVHNVNTFDPYYIQTFNYKYLWGRFWQANGINEKFSVLFKGPGWSPGTARLGDPAGLPAIESPIKKFDVRLSPYLRAYVLGHFVIILHLYTTFINEIQHLPGNVFLSFAVFVILYSITSFGCIFDGKPYGYLLEFTRCVFFIVCNVCYEQFIFEKCAFSSHLLQTLVFDMYIASAVATGILAVSNLWNARVAGKKAQ